MTGVVSCTATKRYVRNTLVFPTFYQKILKDMDSQGFHLDLYDPCLVNKMVNVKHMVII